MLKWQKVQSLNDEDGRVTMKNDGKSEKNLSTSGHLHFHWFPRNVSLCFKGEHQSEQILHIAHQPGVHE